jgi:prevent-host-death family protein
MSETVGVAELRRNLSRYLQRAALGERLVVTDHNRPVAELGPFRPQSRPSTASSPRAGSPARLVAVCPNRSSWSATPGR